MHWSVIGAMGWDHDAGEVMDGGLCLAELPTENEAVQAAMHLAQLRRLTGQPQCEDIVVTDPDGRYVTAVDAGGRTHQMRRWRGSLPACVVEAA